MAPHALLPLVKIPRKLYFATSFFPRTVCDWNSLPHSVATAPSIQAFKASVMSVVASKSRPDDFNLYPPMRKKKLATVTADGELTVTKLVTASRDWAVTWAVIELWPSRDWAVIAVIELWPHRDWAVT